MIKMILPATAGFSTFSEGSAAFGSSGAAAEAASSAGVEDSIAVASTSAGFSPPAFSRAATWL